MNSFGTPVEYNCRARALVQSGVRQNIYYAWHRWINHRVNVPNVFVSIVRFLHSQAHTGKNVPDALNTISPIVDSQTVLRFLAFDNSRSPFKLFLRAREN